MNAKDLLTDIRDELAADLMMHCDTDIADIVGRIDVFLKGHQSDDHHTSQSRTRLKSLLDQAQRNVETLARLIREDGGNHDPQHISDLRKILTLEAEALTRWACDGDVPTVWPRKAQ